VLIIDRNLTETIIFKRLKNLTKTRTLIFKVQFFRFLKVFFGYNFYIFK